MYVEDKAYGENLADFRDFVSKKDPSEEYNWSDHRACACGQYAEKLGIREWTHYIGWWLHKDHHTHDFWGRANALACPHGEVRSLPKVGLRNTFGKLKERLDKELELEPA